MIQYRNIIYDELSPDYFADFKHEQKWDRQWVKSNTEWTLRTTEGHRSWSVEKRVWISKYIRDQISAGGFAIGAFQEEKPIGFICINGTIIDTYANLTMLFVDDNFKRQGIGRNLFQRAKEIATRMGAKKLFISAIPSEETISFYHSAGCKDTEKIVSDFIDTEADRYMEISL